MQPGERISIIFRLFLPLILLVFLRTSPVPAAIQRDLTQARIAQEEGYPQAAADALRRVAAREPWRTNLWERIGQAEYAAGQNAEAESALQNALEAGTLSAEGRFLLGEIQLKLGNPAAAEKTWQDLLHDSGPSARVYERLVDLQRSQGDDAAVVTTLRAWHRSSAVDARAAFLLGLYLSAVQPEEALPYLLESVQRDAGYSEAVQSMRKGLALATNTDQPAYGWLMIGRSLGSIGQWRLAETAFKRSTDLAPGYAEAWAFLGEARVQNGATGKAELDRARALAPQSTVVNALYAFTLRRQAKYQDALVYLQAVAAQEPEEPIWQVEMGNTQVAMGDLSAARASYERAVALAPKNTVYHQALARFSVQYTVDIRGLGLPAARQAVLLSPNDPAALDTMGWTLANLGDAASAERFLQRALEHDPAHASANLHLGQLYLQQQRPAEAYFYLRQAASPGSEESASSIARRLLQRYYGEGG